MAVPTKIRYKGQLYVREASAPKAKVRELLAFQVPKGAVLEDYPDYHVMHSALSDDDKDVVFRLALGGNIASSLPSHFMGGTKTITVPRRSKVRVTFLPSNFLL